MKLIDVKGFDLNGFKIEALSLAKFSLAQHQNITRYIESFVQKKEQKYAIVTEHFQGESLESIIKWHKASNTKLPEQDILSYMTQMISGLEYLHNLYSPHENLKPSNILVNEKGELKMTDIGVPSKFLSKKWIEKLNASGLGYLSSEVLEGGKSSITSDIWLLGCILHEMCCLSPPFTGANMEDLLKNIKGRRYLDEELPEDYNKMLRSMIYVMLNPQAKIESFSDLMLLNEMLVSHIEPK
eukprot:TRINITY_DN542_c0_g1_i4.p1 TRINITY_DN542_c0_g1~~TRINITY_DN542_c0_g1_i4.p1  ORF type:complete len:241 (-),score=48.38 TRINITY_DN542_c0_g1_i4:943-1665(-)